MSHDSTTQLQHWIDRLRAGEAGARDELINHSCGRLRRLVHRMLVGFPKVRPHEDTDDVLQNAVLRLMRALQETQPPTVADFFRLAAWHTRNELLNLTRRYARPKAVVPARGSPDQDTESATPRSAAEPSDSTFHPEKLAAWTEFHEQVQRLPAEEQEVFDLLWYQGLTQHEAASLLGISLATAKRRWMAARLRLQQTLRGVPTDR